MQTQMYNMAEYISGNERLGRYRHYRAVMLLWSTILAFTILLCRPLSEAMASNNVANNIEKAPAAVAPVAQPPLFSTGYNDPMTTYETRQIVLRLPWGDENGKLPYGRTDLGGLEDNVPQHLVWAGKGFLWLLYNNAGVIFVVDTSRRHISSAIDIKAALPPSWQSTIVYSYAVARDPRGGMAAIIGGMPAGSTGFSYMLVRFDVAGNPTGAIPLNQVPIDGNVPEHLAIAEDGSHWIQSGGRLWVMDGNGDLIANMHKTQGVLLSSGIFIAQGDPFRLLNSNGKIIEKIPEQTNNTLDRLIVAGPHNLVLSNRNNGPLGQDWAGQVQLIAIGHVSIKPPRLQWLDIIHLPTLQLLPRDSGEYADGSPIKSYFPLNGITFNDNGDILMLEITPAELLIHQVTIAFFK